MTDQEPILDPNDALDRESFQRLFGPLRPGLKLYCYRMLGSLHEAEDAVQDAYLRAWRGRSGFSGAGSLKAWLYRIGTNACLDAIKRRGKARRILIEDGSPPSTRPPEGAPAIETAWVEPFPDTELDRIPDAAPGPHARIEAMESVRLAFVAAIQGLPPRQRAVLLLCDVLGWSAQDVAALIGGSTTAVNSALQRARATMTSRGSQPAPAPGGSELAGKDVELLARYVRAWQERDLDGFVGLLKDDARYVMPPWREWYFGRDAIGQFFGAVWPRYGAFRLLETRANGQPAFALYTRASEEQPWRVHSLQVVEIDQGAIASIVMFMGELGRAHVSSFGLQAELPA
ncbi:RNA polymerase subunit sigma-70 [Dyella sp. 2RAB6]|uniref:RNA polymerase subunit sigma-70 n=1 Tax=Dyella sp. 2RAB6 TaxID=3232992 RepID=UPI003F9147DF